MTPMRLSATAERLAPYVKALLLVAATTALLLLIGRPTLGEAVIALLLVVPVGWSTSQWGLRPGIAAAIAAALAFDFFFIPPFYTFTVGNLEGWLVLGIFLAVSIAVVGRIQVGLSRAQASEREAVFMYELSSALASRQTPSAVAHTLAEQLQCLFQARLVRVVIDGPACSAPVIAAFPEHASPVGQPDRLLPLWNAWGLAGEVQIWCGPIALPPENSRLLQNFASQAAQALERTRLAEAQTRSPEPAVAGPRSSGRLPAGGQKGKP